MAIVADIRDVHVERYYPDVLLPAKEFQKIAEVENPEFKLVWEVLWKWFINTFVLSLDEDGANRWETMFELYPEPTDTLEDRRERILNRINTRVTYTERSFQQILDTTYGEGKVKIELHYNDYALFLNIVSTLSAKVLQIYTFSRSIVPANLDIFIRTLFDFRNKRRKAIYSDIVRIVSHSEQPIFTEVTVDGKPLYVGGFIYTTEPIKYPPE